MAVIHTTNDNFENEVLRSEKKVLLDFWAPWCGPCRMVSPILEEIARERPDIKVVKVNIAEDLDLAREHKIFSIPTLMVVEDGQFRNKMVGARSKEQLLAVL